MTLHQFKRILQLHFLLHNPRRRNTYESLAAALDRDCTVDPRIIRKDLSFLKKECGAPIVYNSRRGHHYSDPNWQLSQIVVTEGELFSLVLADRLLMTYADSPYIQTLQQGLQRLCDRLNSEVTVNAQELMVDRLWFQRKAELNLDPAIIQAVEQACHQCLQVDMTYHTAYSNSVSDRRLDPYGLVMGNQGLQLVGFCHKSQEIRNFRVDRIQQLRVTEQPFEMQPGFSLQEYMSTAFRWEVGPKARRVVVEFDRATAPFVRGRQWHST
ncbi:MAG: WYL domain-containing transcriptional regulator, partial [Oscillatoriales cyanobacterium]